MTVSEGDEVRGGLQGGAFSAETLKEGRQSHKDMGREHSRQREQALQGSTQGADIRLQSWCSVGNREQYSPKVEK